MLRISFASDKREDKVFTVNVLSKNYTKNEDNHNLVRDLLLFINEKN